MAISKILKDTELVGGIDETEVYPVSTTQALFSQYIDSDTGEIVTRMKDDAPEKLEDRLKDHEDDALELHRKAEKLVVRINNSLSGTYECTGNAYSMTLTGSAGLETYGDEEEEVLSADESKPKHMSDYDLTVNGPVSVNPSTGVMVNGDIPLTEGPTVSGDNVVGLVTISAPGTYISKFKVTNFDGKSSTEKYETSTIYIALRKFYGYRETAPTDSAGIISLNGSDYSSSVAGTITIPKNESGVKFKHVYIALPRYLVGTKTVSARQPDALNAPFPLRKIDTISRTVGESSYDYYLYESGTTSSSEDGYLDSTATPLKRLTLSIS